MFLASLAIAPEGQSRVINVTAEAESPGLSADLANTLVALYLDDKIQARTDESSRTSVWLRERLDELRPEVQEADQAVEDYRRQAGLVEGQQSDVIAQRLSEVNTQLVIAQAERSNAGHS